MVLPINNAYIVVGHDGLDPAGIGGCLQCSLLWNTVFWWPLSCLCVKFYISITSIILCWRWELHVQIIYWMSQFYYYVEGTYQMSPLLRWITYNYILDVPIIVLCWRFELRPQYTLDIQVIYRMSELYIYCLSNIQ